jgi:type I restriction enzyme S subunit
MSTERPLASLIVELPKSRLPAGAAEDNGAHPFFCSSPTIAKVNEAIVEGEAVMMGTGGEATAHFGRGSFSYSTDTWAVHSRTPDLDNEYLWRWLQRRLPMIDYRYFQGTGLRHLQKADVRAMQIELPSIDVQHSVTTALGQLDAAVRGSQAAVAKLHALRAGLMTDVLTRGVDGTGALREPSSDSFKDTPIGRLPNDWEARPVEKLLAAVPNAMRSGPFGSALLKKELRDRGHPLLGIDNVHVEQFVHHYTRFVDDAKFAELQRYAVRPGDIMITIMGTVGRCCVVPDDVGRALSSKHVWTITLDPEKYSPWVACWQVNHAPWVLQQFRRDAQGGVMSAIRSETLRRLLLPVPPRDQLARIEEVLLTANRAIAAEERRLAKWIAIRQGALVDLVDGQMTRLETGS